MKILEAGKLPEPKFIRQGTCSNCKSVIEFSELDGEFKFLYEYHYVNHIERWYNLSVSCPFEGCKGKLKTSITEKIEKYK